MSGFNIYDILACPSCRATLQRNNRTLLCPLCGESYKKEGEIPVLLPKAEPSAGSMDYISHYSVDGEYYDYFAGRESNVTAHEERRVRESLIRQVPANAGLILDVGSGGAWAARHFCAKGREVVSFDISKANIEKALKLLPEENHSGVVGDGLNPPFVAESFDCIIASEIIEHIIEPQAFINSLIELLKPGGSLVVSTPYKEELQYYICIHCNKPTPKNAHIHSFDEIKLSSFVKNRSGLTCKCQIFGNKALTVLRTHVLLQHLPLAVWRAVDSISNLVLNKPAHIIAVYKKDLLK
jgi:SAM-dependent methyltransferase